MNNPKTFIKRKFFIDYLKEEKWLNHMASQGHHLIGCSPFTYVFQEGEPGAYTYHLELLNNLPSNTESQQYMEFLEEMGAEIVGTHWRWIFIKLKRGTNAKELFSDLTSKLKHHKRVMTLYVCLIAINIPNTINLTNILFTRQYNFGDSILLYICYGLLITLLLSLTRMLFRHYRQCKKYEKEQQIYDK